MAAAIDQMAIAEEERIYFLERMKTMMIIWKRKDYTQGNITTLFKEWESVAQRLRTGEAMLEETKKQSRSADPMTNPHYVSLSHLYMFLSIICGIYDDFFKEMFAHPNDHAKYQRAHNSIMNILVA